MEQRISALDVPHGAWSSAYALPPEQVLLQPLDAIATQLTRQYPDLEFQDVRLVATTRDSTVYVAAETPIQNSWGRSSLETRVWTSHDGGTTWRALLYRMPRATCDYAITLTCAVLHPDRIRVFLGTDHGLFLDAIPLALPPQAERITALHVSANGAYLYVATDDLSTLCEWPTYVFSVAGLYRLHLGVEPSTPPTIWGAWDDLTSPLIRSVAPLEAVGSDPADPEQAFLRSASGALFRKRVLKAVDYGWEPVSPTAVPTYLRFDR